MPSGGSQLSNKIGVSRKIQLACGMPLFNFGFLKPIKKPAPVHHEDDEDSGDEIVHGPVARRSHSTSSIRTSSIQAASRRSTVGAGVTRRRAVDFSDNTSGAWQERRGGIEAYNSDNGMLGIPSVGLPGSIMGPPDYCSVLEVRRTEDYSIVKGLHLATEREMLAKVYDRATLIPSKEAQVLCQGKVLTKLTRVDGVLQYYLMLSDARHIALLFKQDLRLTLKTHVAIHGGKLSENYVCKQVAAPLVMLLSDVHRLGIIHRNISPEHILFNEDEPLALIDFDEAVDCHPVKLTDDDDTSPGLPNYRVGALEYMAPEVVEKPTAQEVFHEVVFKGMSEEELPMYDTKADIYSLGAMLFAILSGKPLFKCEHASELQQFFRSADIPKIISEECCSLTASGRNFLEQCLVLNPHHRPGSTALLQHAWIKPYIEQVRADYMKFRTPPLELTSKSGRGAARRSMSLPALPSLKAGAANFPVLKAGTLANFDRCPVNKDVLTNNSFC